MDVIKKSQSKKEIEEDVVSRKSVLNLINSDWKYEGLEVLINGLPSVIPHIKKKDIGLDVVQTVFMENVRNVDNQFK